MANKQLILVFILTCHTILIYGQQNLTLFLMHDVPQANFVNPAVSAKCPLIIGIPGISSLHANYSNTAFTANQLVISQNDSLYFAPDKAISQMKGIELVSSEIHYSPIYLGLWIKQSYWTFAITEKLTSYNTINDNAARLAWKGNYPDFTGYEASLNGVRANASHYREYALGWARQTNERLQIGIRGKLLFGKGSVYMPRTRGGFYTNQRNFGIDVRLNTAIQTSFPIEVTTDDDGYITDMEVQEDFDWMGYLMNRSNLGLGFDFGLIYDYNENTTLSASLLDIGFINWKTNTYQFKSNGSFQYYGTSDASGYDNPDYIENIGDSLEHIFKPKPLSEGYSSPLIPQLYLGATHLFTDHINGGIVIRNEIFRNKIHSSFTLSANTYNYEIFNASLSYSAINGDYFNIGAGVGVKLGAFHIHAITDDIFAFFNLSKTRGANLRLGFSIVPGCSDTKKAMKKPKKGISALPCYFDPYHKKARK